MPILVDRDREFNPAIKKIMDKLDEILRYQVNFDSEIFDSLSRLEEKIDLIKLAPRPLSTEEESIQNQMKQTIEKTKQEQNKVIKKVK